jgi:formylglycine-generating enzyme required for sulfatase activity
MNRFALTRLAAGAATLALLAACERKSPSDISNTPAVSPEKPASQGQTNRGTPRAEDAMVHMAGGKFLMGDKEQVDASPHEVLVGPFYIDKYLVTQELYEKVTGTNPSRWKGARNPVEQVRWSDAVTFCNKRSEMEGRQPCYDLTTWKCNFEANGYRLPTEAEWEYACRAGAATAYFFGDTADKLKDHAWFDKNAGGRPRPVGQKQPNAWGLYDMCGNVWEWCNDFYQVDYYGEAPRDNPRGPDQGETKVVRGGAWRFGEESCRAGYRYNENPGYSDVCFGYDIYGFRCVRNGPPPSGQ